MNFKVGDKVGEGDIMVEIEYYFDYWDGNFILGGKGYYNFWVKWFFMSLWKWFLCKVLLIFVWKC